MPKRVSIRGNIVRIGRVRDGQPIRHSEHDLNTISRPSLMRLALKMRMAWPERQRDARGRWIPSVLVWESVSEQVARMVARRPAKEQTRANKRRTKGESHD